MRHFLEEKQHCIRELRTDKTDSFINKKYSPGNYKVHPEMFNCQLKYRQTGLYYTEWMDIWINEWADGWMGGWMDGWIDGRMDRWMDGWMDRWMNRWMDG